MNKYCEGCNEILTESNTNLSPDRCDACQVYYEELIAEAQMEEDEYLRSQQRWDELWIEENENQTSP